MSVVLSENNLAAAVVASFEKGLDSSSPLFGLRKNALAELQKLGFPSGKNI